MWSKMKEYFNPGNTAISIVVIVRNESVRRFIVQTLNLRTDFYVTGVYDSPEVFLSEPASQQAPQVVLLDNSLQTTGLLAIRKLKHRNPKSDVVIFTFVNKSEDIYNAFCAGATGHILQSDAVETVISNIQDIICGNTIILPSIAQKILDGHFSSNDYTLSVPEVQLLQTIIDGHAIPYIRDTLKVPAHVMRSQFKSIFRKLHNSTQTATTSH